MNASRVEEKRWAGGEIAATPLAIRDRSGVVFCVDGDPNLDSTRCCVAPLFDPRENRDGAGVRCGRGEPRKTIFNKAGWVGGDGRSIQKIGKTERGSAFKQRKRRRQKRRRQKRRRQKRAPPESQASATGFSLSSTRRDFQYPSRKVWSFVNAPWNRGLLWPACC